MQKWKDKALAPLNADYLVGRRLRMIFASDLDALDVEFVTLLGGTKCYATVDDSSGDWRLQTYVKGMK